MKVELVPLISVFLPLGFQRHGLPPIAEQGRAGQDSAGVALWEGAITEISLGGRELLVQILWLPGHSGQTLYFLESWLLISKLGVMLKDLTL